MRVKKKVRRPCMKLFPCHKVKLLTLKFRTRSETETQIRNRTAVRLKASCDRYQQCLIFWNLHRKVRHRLPAKWFCWRSFLCVILTDRVIKKSLMSYFCPSQVLQPIINGLLLPVSLYLMWARVLLLQMQYNRIFTFPPFELQV